MSEYLSREFRPLAKVNAYLPPEIIGEMLRRLPVESAVKCTSVCKAWYALIKNPSFITSHLQAAALHDELLLLRFLIDSRDFYRLHHDNDAFEQYKKLPSPFRFKYKFDLYTMLGTCNGLICLAHVQPCSCSIVLWNPSIRKHFILPRFDLPGKRYYESTLGFGFDSVSNDYKVLLNVPEGDNRDSNEVWLYSLNRRSWMRLSEDSIKLRCERRQAAFVNGALHWTGYLKDDSSSYMILAFDICTEKLSVMNFPQTLVHSDPEVSSLIKYDGTIAVVKSDPYVESGSGPLELWVMKEYGVSSSWTKVLHSLDKNGESVFGAGLYDVFGVRKNGEVLLKVEGKDPFELAMVDLNCGQREDQQQQLKRLVTLGYDYRESFVGSFVESLVLLDIGEDVL